MKSLSFAKNTLFVYAVAGLCLWEILCQQYGFNLFLAETWYTIAWWVMLGILGVTFICLFPLMTTTKKEEAGVVRSMGTEPYNKFLWVYPHLAFAAAFIQYSSILMAIVCVSCFACSNILISMHTRVLLGDVVSDAKRGNVK